MSLDFLLLPDSDLARIQVSIIPKDVSSDAQDVDWRRACLFLFVNATTIDVGLVGKIPLGQVGNGKLHNV